MTASAVVRPGPPPGASGDRSTAHDRSTAQQPDTDQYEAQAAPDAQATSDAQAAPDAQAVPDAPDDARRRRSLRGILRGPTDQPAWARPAVLALLAVTAVLYLWDLAASGYANSYYAAAAQAGSQSWKALLFGSLDSGNAITVDKPPASLWIMSLSAHIFGFSSWSILAPQALEGVAAVGLLYATVRRRFGCVAGLVAGATLAVTPVAVLMFRFNHPDALLVLLLVAGAYCVVCATESASGWWLALAGVALGFGFLTKMMQAFLVLPAFGLTYLVAAPATLWRRVVHLLGATATLVASAGWFLALVAIWPASSRPYIGGSSSDSLLQLALEYNGLGRIFGGSGNPGGTSGGTGGGGGGGFGGTAGITRLFNDSIGAEISWLLPAALIMLVAGLWFTRNAPRTDQTRASLILWGGWLITTGGVFSYMSGIFHPYYTVALAPAIAALIAIGGRELWRARTLLAPRIMLATAVAITGAWSWSLLGRTASWMPALRWFVLAASSLAAIALVVRAERFARRVAPTLATAVLAATLAGTLTGGAAFAVATVGQTHHGSMPTSGPAAASGMGGGQGGPGAQQRGADGQSGPSGRATAGQGGPGGQGASTALTALLKATNTEWAAAVSGAMSAAELELSSGKAVIAIGGWNGGDPSPTLDEFKRYVEQGRIRFLITSTNGGRGGAGGPDGAGGASATSQITSWVKASYSTVTVDGATVYDLTKPKSS